MIMLGMPASRTLGSRALQSATNFSRLSGRLIPPPIETGPLATAQSSPCSRTIAQSVSERISTER